MRVQLAASRWRIVPVVLGSTAAYIAFAVFVYWLYFRNVHVVYDDQLRLVTLQIFFYLAVIVHLRGSFGAAAALTIWARVPIYPTYAAVVVTFAILLVPLVLYLSTANACTAYVSFPIPGFVCDD